MLTSLSDIVDLVECLIRWDAFEVFLQFGLLIMFLIILNLFMLTWMPILKTFCYV